MFGWIGPGGFHLHCPGLPIHAAIIYEITMYFVQLGKLTT